MSLELAVRHALQNPIKSRGRTSISRFATVLTNGYNTFIGLNSYKSHPLQARFAIKTGFPEKIHIHSEIAAIAQVARQALIPNWAKLNPDLSDYRMYIARVLADGSPALARPCPGCMAAITEFGIKHVEWTE
jgi:tRNA(Arg) A34 adenosine deaminase TadA